MLGRRSFLLSAAAVAASATAWPALAAARRARSVEIRLRIKPPMLLGGARLLLSLPQGAEIVMTRSDATSVEHTSEALTADWRPGAVSPWIEATIRAPAIAGVAPPSIVTAAGVLPPRSFACEIERCEILA